MSEIMAKYDLWCQRATEDADVVAELQAVAGRDAEIRDRFYRELAFGTGGLRGVIGAGSNRMNIYTVRKATQGLANYLNDRYETSTVSVPSAGAHPGAQLRGAVLRLPGWCYGYRQPQSC